MTQITTIQINQRGSFLLEAMVSVLIVSFGILGIVGLMARSVQFTNDAQYRGEAVHMTNSVIAQMWSDDRLQLAAKYTAPGQIGYDTFKALTDTLPGAAAIANNPQITVVSPGAGLTANSADVTVTVQWQAPGDPLVHQFVSSATLGQNW